MKERLKISSREILSGLTLFLVTLSGCGSDSESAKRSHFEHDHEVADHWPSDLADVATRMRKKLDLLEAGTSDSAHLREEIADLVGWAPEIAADTELSEADWLPIYRAGESLSACLQAAGSEIGQADREQALKFCELIDASVTKIPEQYVSIEDE